jgi:hypothetical protein
LKGIYLFFRNKKKILCISELESLYSIDLERCHMCF